MTQPPKTPPSTRATASACLLLLAAGGARAQTTTADEPPQPWRLNEALGLPDWISIRGQQRTRYASHDGQFRANFNGNDEVFEYRTAIEATLRFEPLEVVAEGMDSRQSLADSSTPINNTVVNALELLQGYVAYRQRNVLEDDDELFVLAGRHTMNVGKRRLVARNNYRNTINNFTGINAVWNSAQGHHARAFWVLPVERLPTGRQALLDNRPAFDEERIENQFIGAFLTIADLIDNTELDVGAFGLMERDSPDQATRNRRLFTATMRLFREHQAGAYDFEFETAIQTGRSRASSSGADTDDLNHLAHFQHAEVGYTFETRWTPRLALQFDYASGDTSPNDNENNRYDTIFGSRRFDFGPASTFGAFARSNLISPGYRITFRPHEAVSVMIAHRFYWLASARDAWTTSGVVDPTGNAGRYVGTLPELRVRWDAFPGNLRIEGGLAKLFVGDFVDDAPNANGEGDATYGYVQTILTF
ncbi:MAG: alginate export family protein [Planctomycetota bacterium]